MRMRFRSLVFVMKGGIGHGQHNWGDGQRLAGAILENVILPHHNQDPKQLAGYCLL
jgi:hypothetical protein